MRARKILVATGAAPVIPEIPGLDLVPFSTYLDIFDRDELPQSMIIIGGGPIGVEMAQAYQRLGVQITVFAERLLPKEEPEASTTIQRILEREGVRILQARPQSVERSTGRIHVRSQSGNADGAEVVGAAAPA